MAKTKDQKKENEILKEEGGKRGSGPEILTRIAYRPEDIAGFDYKEWLNDPGKFPFTRGIHETMYRGKLWTMRQYSGFSIASDTNSQFKFLIEQGQTGLSLALDLPTQLGLDSDHPMAKNDVGKLGVAIDTLKDMEDIFDGIPLDKISTSMTINSTASILLAMYIVTGEKQGVSKEKLRGTIQNDIIKEYIARGTWIFPPEPSIRLIGDTIAYCYENIPRFNAVSVSGTHICEAGADRTQGIAYPFLTGIAYIEEVLKRGYTIDQIAPLFSFHLVVGGIQFHVFQDVAKLRAARRLWAKIIKERFGAKDESSMKLTFSTGGMGSGMTEQQPLNNIARIAYYALSAALAGSRSMNLPCFDEAYAIPTQEAIRTSLRIQQILAFETGITDTVDPLAGSYYIETLTNYYEEEIRKEMEKIDGMGGIIKCVENGYIQRKLAEQAYETERKIQKGEIVRVGVNRFSIEEETREIEVFQHDPDILQKQREKLNRIKADRDNKMVRESLGKLKEAAAQERNVMPHITDAVKAYATLGEIVDVLKEVYGEGKEPSSV